MNKNSATYRLWEILPGAFAWTTITFPIWGSFIVPKLVAYFVIGFLIYWIYQSYKSAIFATIGYFKIKKQKTFNWQEKYQQDKQKDWLDFNQIHHAIFISIIPKHFNFFFNYFIPVFITIF